MVDIVNWETRSRMMSGIRGKNTKPELLVRKYLHSKGLRFKLHAKGLPGKPDLVFPKYKTVVFVHGCFWHGHDCPLFKWPTTNINFWRTKILGNQVRFNTQKAMLKSQGWRVIVVYECALKGRTSKSIEKFLGKLEFKIRSGATSERDSVRD